MDNERIISIRDNLTVLGEACLDFLASQSRANLLPPTMDSVYIMIGDSYEYQLKKGLVCTSWKGYQKMEPSWSIAIFKIVIQMRKHPAYSSLVSEVIEQFPRRASSHAIDQYIAFISRQFILGTQDVSEIDLISIIDRLIDDFEMNQVHYMLNALIRGVTLESELLRLSEKVTIRRSRREDVEKPDFMSDLMGHDRMMLTSSVVLDMEMDLLFGERDSIRKTLDTYICILCLFGTGAVQYIKFDLDSNTVLRNSGEGTTDSNLVSDHVDTYCIYKNDESAFLDFCKEFFTKIESIADRSSTIVTFLTIAWGRYKDSLIKQEIAEKRVASATMGLEALFSNDKQEILYKLYQRVAKVFSFLGKKSIGTVRVIKDAYTIRSLYVHGSHLNEKEKKKLIEKYGSIESFTLELLDYLRISILLYFQINLEKDKFVTLIDAAMVDEQTSDELRKILLPVVPHAQKQNERRESL